MISGLKYKDVQIIFDVGGCVKIEFILTWNLFGNGGGGEDKPSPPHAL